VLVLLYNSISGSGLGKKQAQNAMHFLDQKQIPYKSYCDNWPETFDSKQTIWLFGGDGTLNFFLNKYGLITNSIALFAGGTGNDVHHKIYGEKSTEEMCDFLLYKAEAKATDVAQCNGEYFINGVGIGFDGEVLKGMSKIRKLGGHLGYLMQVLKVVFSYKEVAFKLTFNGKSENQKLLLLNIANSDRTGGGFRISPLADMQDGKLNLLRCHALPVFKRLRYLPAIQKGKHLGLPFIEHETLSKIQVQTAHAVSYQLDGELRETNHFNIEICKGKVYLLG
jgi:diacylglycerol kinase (ATP)